MQLNVNVNVNKLLTENTQLGIPSESGSGM